MLVKFCSEKQHADELLAGRLFARRLKDFRETEDRARRDKLEGTVLWEGGTLSLRGGDGEWLTVQPDELTGPIERRFRLHDNLNLFCMTAFRSEVGPWPSWQLMNQIKQQIDESLPTCAKMGDHAVVITNAAEFRRRVSRAAKRERYLFRSSLVKYYDSYPPDVAFGDERSFMPAFLKRSEYRLEKEFRIALSTGAVGNEPVTLDIGHIRDIGFYTKTRELANLKVRMIGTCPRCCSHPCESYGPQPHERLGDRRSESHELHDFLCEKCGRFSMTVTAETFAE